MRTQKTLYVWMVLGLLAVAPLQAGAESLSQLMQRPLIIGASVSSDFGTLSPGKRLALRYTNGESILVNARNGRLGLETMRALREEDLDGRTIVIAVDLFFWDATQVSAEASLAALETLLNWTARRNQTLVLGDIPVFSRVPQMQRDRLNQQIHRRCTRQVRCFIFPLDRFRSQGSAQANGRSMRVAEALALDRVHLTAAGSEFLADLMAELFL